MCIDIAVRMVSRALPIVTSSTASSRSVLRASPAKKRRETQATAVKYHTRKPGRGQRRRGQSLSSVATKNPSPLSRSGSRRRAPVAAKADAQVGLDALRKSGLCLLRLSRI